VNSASEFLIHCTGFSREKKHCSLMNSAEEEKQPRAALNLTAF
jgi:hypothetical protein